MRPAPVIRQEHAPTLVKLSVGCALEAIVHYQKSNNSVAQTT